MDKMIGAQSIVVASSATRWPGREGEIRRYVFIHSIVLTFLAGLPLFPQASVPPLTSMVAR